MNEDILNSMKDYCIEIVDTMREEFGENGNYSELLQNGYALSEELASVTVIKNSSFVEYMELFDECVTVILDNFLIATGKKLGIF